MVIGRGKGKVFRWRRRGKNVSVHTTAMLLPREKERFCSYHCPLAIRGHPIQLKDAFTEGKRTFLFIPLPLSYQGAPYSTKGDGFLEEANSISFDDIS
uniref:Uncharacterized protein n=1 Tax=Picea glauca TaxID=3330 RepID=A0A101M5B2_PICGL|nr:hypothetical protein ABT39_MTgene1208 [Picea glauca]